MSTFLFYSLVSAPVWASLGFLAGASLSYFTKKDLFSAWELLALRSLELLSKCEEDSQRFGQGDLDPLREAIRLLEELDALPKTLSSEPAACRSDET